LIGYERRSSKRKFTNPASNKVITMYLILSEVFPIINVGKLSKGEFYA